LSFEYFRFVSWIALWAWILSDIVAKYIIPSIDKFYVAVADIGKPNQYEGKLYCFFKKIISLLIAIVFTLLFTYITTSWSVWCILRYVKFTHGLDVYGWVYFISGGILCELALGKVARASTYNGFLGMLPHIMAMGAYLCFPLDYNIIRTVYPWLINFVGLNSL
jgi:hypothetical protein